MNVTQLLELLFVLSAAFSATVNVRNLVRRQQAKAKFLKIERRLIN
jgi:hypothetical protein